MKQLDNWGVSSQLPPGRKRYVHDAHLPFMTGSKNLSSTIFKQPGLVQHNNEWLVGALIIGNREIKMDRCRLSICRGQTFIF